MIDFIQRFRIFILVVASALFLLGLGFESGGGPKGAAFILFSIPGIMIALTVYLTSQRGQGLFSRSDTNQKSGSADELLKWHQLKKDGVISDAQFEEKKKKLLG